MLWASHINAPAHDAILVTDRALMSASSGHPMRGGLRGEYLACASKPSQSRFRMSWSLRVTSYVRQCANRTSAYPKVGAKSILLFRPLQIALKFVQQTREVLICLFGGQLCALLLMRNIILNPRHRAHGGCSTSVVRIACYNEARCSSLFLPDRSCLSEDGKFVANRSHGPVSLTGVTLVRATTRATYAISQEPRDRKIDHG
jgi:hypothetical protein